jgi:DNA mismatch repair protein MutS2
MYLCLQNKFSLKLFPESAGVQLEFEKIKQILTDYCSSQAGKSLATGLRIHTRKDFIDIDLRQSYEYLHLMQTGLYFPNDHTLNLHRELKLLGIPGAVLRGEDFLLIRKLADSIHQIFRWFDSERTIHFPSLYKVISGTHYEKAIIARIDEVLTEQGHVKDEASPELARIRLSLYRKRNELRRQFDRIIQKLNKAGFSADIEESFLNGRRVVAIQAEFKRQVKGIFHGESDTRRTTFINLKKPSNLTTKYSRSRAKKARKCTGYCVT